LQHRSYGHCFDLSFLEIIPFQYDQGGALNTALSARRRT